MKQSECTELEWSLYKQVVNLTEKANEVDENIKVLKYLNIAYQAAIAYDNCPDIDEAEEIKENEIFAEKLELSDIQLALDHFAGWSPSDFESKIISAINCL